MSPAISQRIKIFRTVRDIPYRIGLSWDDQDYCCATKTPMLQKLLASLDIESRRICCRFEWKTFGLPPEIMKLATSAEAGHEYLEVLVPENDQWIKVDPTWDSRLQSVGLPVTEWDGLTSTALAVTPTKVFTPEESADIIKQIETMPPEAWENFFDQNRAFLGAINTWLEQSRLHSRIHGKESGRKAI